MKINKEIVKLKNDKLSNVQCNILAIMVEFNRICDKYKIKYILDGGSMLGAVRHNGFIPWDDDMDVAMTRKEYKKFIVAVKKENNPNFYFESIETNPYFPYSFAKFRLKGTVYEERGFENAKCDNGIWLDIFPMDKSFNCTYKLQSKLHGFFKTARFLKSGVTLKKEYKFRKLLSKLPIGVINFFSELPIRFLNFLPIKKVCKLCHEGPRKVPHSLSFYLDISRHKFEDFEFLIPKEYDLFLRTRYKNYMELPDIKDRKPSHGGGKVFAFNRTKIVGIINDSLSKNNII